MSAIMNWIAWCVGDRNAELDALARVGDGELERRAGDPGRHRGDARARAIERLHRDPEAVVLLADQVVGRDLDVGEGDRRGVRGALAHLVLVAVDERRPPRAAR